MLSQETFRNIQEHFHTRPPANALITPPSLINACSQLTKNADRSQRYKSLKETIGKKSLASAIAKFATTEASAFQNGTNTMSKMRFLHNT